MTLQLPPTPRLALLPSCPHDREKLGLSEIDLCEGELKFATKELKCSDLKLESTGDNAKYALSIKYDVADMDFSVR